MKRTFFLLLATFAAAISLGAWSQDAVRVVLKGHDPVAYFTDGKPVMGNPKISYDWDDGRYYFASAQHRDMFAKDPERYAPQFGGYCTGSMAGGNTREGDPEAWVIREGRLYVFGATKWSEVARKDPAYMPTKVPAAAKNWTDKKSQKSS